MHAMICAESSLLISGTATLGFDQQLFESVIISDARGVFEASTFLGFVARYPVQSRGRCKCCPAEGTRYCRIYTYSSCYRCCKRGQQDFDCRHRGSIEVPTWFKTMILVDSGSFVTGN